MLRPLLVLLQLASLPRALRCGTIGLLEVDRHLLHVLSCVDDPLKKTQRWFREKVGRRVKVVYGYTRKNDFTHDSGGMLSYVLALDSE